MNFKELRCRIMDWRHVAQNRDQWLVLVKIVGELQFIKKDSAPCYCGSPIPHCISFTGSPSSESLFAAPQHFFSMFSTQLFRHMYIDTTHA
jgi:hypothetical protein